MSRARTSIALALLVVTSCADDGSSASNDTTGDTDPSASATETESGMTMGPATTPSSSSTEDPTMGPGPDDSTTDDPTGEALGCEGPEDCPDEEPFCIVNVCVECESTGDGDAACAELDEARPVCSDGRCVVCTEDNVGACTGTTPICDAATKSCVACTYHEQCQAIGLPACHVAEGSCFDARAVTEVDAGTPGSIQQAIDAVAGGDQHAIVISGEQSAFHAIEIDGGKIIALISNSQELRSVRGDNSEVPVIAVAGGGTTAYLHRVRIERGLGWGVVASSGATLYVDNAQIDHNTGGGIQLASTATGYVRSSFVPATDSGSSIRLAFASRTRRLNYSIQV